MYVVRAAASSIGRNKLLTLVSLGVVVVSIFMLGSFLVIAVNVRGLVSQVKEKVEIRAFLRDDLDEKAVTAARLRIEQIEGVKSVSYVSKKEAYERFKEELQEKSDLLEAIETNPFPASFEVSLLPEYRTGKKASVIASEISTVKGVEEAEYGKEWTSRLDEAVRILFSVGATVGVLIAISCLFLVFNTIRLTVFARKEEIEIMSLVGATDGFIRRPFLLVGIFYGLVGGGLATALLYGVHEALSLKIPAITFLETPHLAGLILFAALLGYFGSLFSVKKFLVA
jgi:cell division transport system permease protein